MTKTKPQEQPPILIENGKREALKLIAIVTMLIDHVGIVVFENQEIFRIIGRISFPIFALLLAEGFIRTKHPRQYASRLFIFFLISQIPFVAALQKPEYLNIFFDLFVGFIMLWLLKTNRTVIFGLLLFAVAVLPGVTGYSLDYSWYGLLAMVLSYLYFTRRITALSAYGLFSFITCFLVFSGDANWIQLFAMASPLLMYAIVSSNVSIKRLPKYLYYSFYPAHLFVLWLLFR